MSPIFGLYPDAHNEAQNVLEAAVAGTAALEAVDHLGVTHRLWPVTNQSLIQEVASLVQDKPMFVADGHHRYETACNYRDELAAAAGGALPNDHPARSVLSMCMSMDDPGLIVLPTHRLFSGAAEMTAAELTAKLEGCFDCDPMGTGPDQAAAVWQQIVELDDQGVFGFYTAKDQAWTLVSANANAATRMQKIAGQQSDDWRSLGVAILHHLILEELLGQRDLPKATYVHLVEEVVDGLAGRLEGNQHYPLAALVMPATVDDVRKVSLHNERMPAKSTYFYPKLLSGLVVNPLNAN